ncbi:MAG: HEAT repeat domain-containing protein [Desulfuromonadaceae bacterium]|nr:HEAT repeat domain-containing protein [Desulfuromonadaceae bacterium]
MKEIARSRIGLLRPLLKDPVPGVRIAAAAAIETLEAASSIEGVLATLKTGNMGAKIGAIYALGEIGGEKVIPPLVYCARRVEVDIRSAAVAVLGKLALPATLGTLVEILDDECAAVAARAIAALSRFAVPADVIKKLRTFLNASDGVLEAEAALTLAGLNDVSSSDQIAALLASPHASTRQAAATALSRMPLLN